MLLKDIVDLTLGKNTTRLDASANIYRPEDFDSDLKCINSTDNIGSCIINLMKSTAAPISVENSKKCITSNFLKCEFDNTVLDPWYFCYQFNESKQFRNQINRYHQGSTQSVKKLNIGTIGDFEITIPSLKEQITIGKIYKESVIKKYLMQQQAEQVYIATIEVIRSIEEEKNE